MTRPTDSTSIDELIQIVSEFSNRPEWDSLHTPKNLAIAISCEAAELLELFKWGGEESLPEPDLDEVTRELADVVIYALEFARRLDIDVAEAVKQKVLQNYEKYPKS